MKFFHLSDLHIGLRLMNYDLKKDFEYIFAQIITWAKKEEPEVIVIAGDIYDKAVPSAEAVEMFDYCRKSRQCNSYQFISQCIEITKDLYDWTATENEGGVHGKGHCTRSIW